MSTELYHYGVKGMRWGVRRTQKAVKKYSQKAQKQVDFHSRNTNTLKKILDSNYSNVEERSLTKQERKAYVKEYERSINDGKKWLATKNDIMKMDVSKFTANDVKKRYDDTRRTTAYYLV